MIRIDFVVWSRSTVEAFTRPRNSTKDNNTPSAVRIFTWSVPAAFAMLEVVTNWVDPSELANALNPRPLVILGCVAAPAADTTRTV